jgi:hypothetical protein
LITTRGAFSTKTGDVPGDMVNLRGGESAAPPPAGNRNLSQSSRALRDRMPGRAGKSRRFFAPPLSGGCAKAPRSAPNEPDLPPNEPLLVDLEPDSAPIPPPPLNGDFCASRFAPRHSNQTLRPRRTSPAHLPRFPDPQRAMPHPAVTLKHLPRFQRAQQYNFYITTSQSKRPRPGLLEVKPSRTTSGDAGGFVHQCLKRDRRRRRQFSHSISVAAATPGRFAHDASQVVFVVSRNHVEDAVTLIE